MWLRNRRRIRRGHASSFGVLGETWGAGRASVGKGESYRWGGPSSPCRGLAMCRGWLWDGVPRPGRGEWCEVGRSRGSDGLPSPGCVEGSRERQLIVQGDAHVARLAEGRGYGSGGVAEEAAPAQEQHLGCGKAGGREPGASSAATWPLSVSGVLGGGGGPGPGALGTRQEGQVGQEDPWRCSVEGQSEAGSAEAAHPQP